MKERPILFSAPMVRAILDGSKTQTRRVAKEFAGRSELDAILKRFPNQNGCPYGQPGERLWVRETWQFYDWTEDGEPCIRFGADNQTTWPEPPRNEALVDQWEILSHHENYSIDNAARDRRWRPSIHMPRWASRILLEIVSVRVERLSECSEADALAEGIDADELAERQDSYDIVCKGTGASGRATAQSMYRELWESINGAGRWEANPWVWVVEFKRVMP